MEDRHVVGKLFKLVAANRIPFRHARLLAYLAQLLLHGQSGVRHETICAQNYHSWQQTLRTVYPAVPRVAPAPLPRTLHRENAANDARQ